ncbi:MAG: hypothetical protein GF398_21015 [Chitinivibrionales bacterium]|nr:hypothetical protein [Chitinivibrionales bacterium]
MGERCIRVLPRWQWDPPSPNHRSDTYPKCRSNITVPIPFFFSKLIPVFFYPLGFSLLLIAASGVLALFRKKKTSIILIVASVCTLYISSLSLTEHALVRSLESNYPQPISYPNATAIVLLGGAGRPAIPPRKYHETSHSADRILHAARLFKHRYAPRIITTGGRYHFIKAADVSEAQVNKSLLVELFGIDSSAVITENESLNTHDHPIKIADIINDLRLPHEIILVTSATHMHRSVLCFEKFGFIVHPAPTDFHADERWNFTFMSFLPKSGSLNSVTRALHEYYGMAAYKAFGWI